MRGWKLSDIGRSEGPSTGDRHKPEGQIDFAPNFSEARQDVPYEHDFHKLADVNFAAARVDVADPYPETGVPSPFCGDAGHPIDFNSVAPDDDTHGALAPDGSGGGSDHMPPFLD
jgi:hypothetical protein